MPSEPRKLYGLAGAFSFPLLKEEERNVYPTASASGGLTDGGRCGLRGKPVRTRGSLEARCLGERNDVGVTKRPARALPDRLRESAKARRRTPQAEVGNIANHGSTVLDLSRQQ